MATFNTKKTLYASPSLIPAIAKSIENEFRGEEYEISVVSLISGGYDISIAKGNLFKAILGMKTALKISILPQNGNIYFEAGVGIWGQQSIPTVISMLVFWPVLITQIWGLIQQAKLDDKALAIAERVISTSNFGNYNGYNTVNPIMPANKKFCTSCGVPNPMEASFCYGCGKPM